jgi:hypothetical protein
MAGGGAAAHGAAGGAAAGMSDASVTDAAGEGGMGGGAGVGGSSGGGGAGGVVGGAGAGGSAGAGGAAGAIDAGGSSDAGGLDGSADAGDGDAGATTPVALCERVVATICKRLQSCPGVLTDPSTFVEADCERRENVEFGCDRATSNAFLDCLSDVTAVSCAGLFSPTAGLVLPASCDAPLNSIPLSSAQQKCADLAAADCMRQAECLGVTPTADQLQQCQIQDYDSAGCGFAVSVGPTYAACLAHVETAPCSAGGGAPDAGGSASSCDTAIVFVQ